MDLCRTSTPGCGVDSLWCVSCRRLADLHRATRKLVSAAARALLCAPSPPLPRRTQMLQSLWAAWGSYQKTSGHAAAGQVGDQP